MFSWIKRLFRAQAAKEEAVALPTVAPGDRWIFSPRNGDPFGAKPYRPVVVLDVRDGWVRYDMGPGPFRDERKTINEFVGMYRLVTPNPELTAAALWRQEAINCTEAFMFDTAVTKAVPYYIDSTQVEAARTAICGPWDAQRAEAALRALETYAEQVQAPSRKSILEVKQAAVIAARQAYNKGAG